MPTAKLASIQRAFLGRALGLQVIILSASSDRDIQAAFEGLAGQRIGALLVGADPFFASRREQLVALAARYGVPATYMTRDFVEAGGLASYGASVVEAYRQAGVYVARILKGDKPGELPVIQAAKYEFVLNLKAARALGINVSMAFSAAADEIIE